MKSRLGILTLSVLFSAAPGCGADDDESSPLLANSATGDVLTRHLETALPTLVRPDRFGSERLRLREPSAPLFTAARVLGNGKTATVEISEVAGRLLQRERVYEAANGHEMLVGTKAFFADMLLVQLAADVDPAAGRARLEALGYEVVAVTSYGLARVRMPVRGITSAIDAQAAIAAEAGLAAHVSLDELVPVTATSNDPYLCAQYYHGAGDQLLQLIQSADGSWGCDELHPMIYDGKNRIGSAAAWDIRTDASAVTVAIIDTGFDYTHPDLAANAWVNSGEIPGNGLDDDSDGIIDDVHGCNAVTATGDPQENGSFHGTNVAGVIGARGDNGIGVAGIAWNVKLLGVRAEPDGLYGSLDLNAIVAGVDYAIQKHAAIINMSFGAFFAMPTVADAIGRAKAAGIIVVAASGNDGVDIDATPFYPASYKLQHDNVVVVGGTSWQFGDAWELNWGARTVDLGAPSQGIVTTATSTYSTPGYPPGYFPFNGTSAAAPLVSGSLALLAAQFPSATYRALIDRLLAGVVTEPGFAGKCVTGGRVNVYNAMAGTTWKRTVVFIYGPTQVGQDMFVRGGIDHGYAQQVLGRSCTSTNGLCAIPIRHRNLLNATTLPWKNGDTLLDWYGLESGQGAGAEGSALDWTTNRWPPEWGTARFVATDGYGETPLNRWGHHYWMLDVDMDCSRSVNTWFELKSYISNGPGWEADIYQPGAPWSSHNHFARCGYLNVFRRGESNPVTLEPLTP